jgi:hypothetical protein
VLKEDCRNKQNELQEIKTNVWLLIARSERKFARTSSERIVESTRERTQSLTKIFIPKSFTTYGFVLSRQNIFFMSHSIFCTTGTQDSDFAL